MKYVIFLLILASCKLEPDGYVNGQPYRLNTYCVKSHTKEEFGYYWGYNWRSGKHEWHWGNETKTICDLSQTDTVWMEKE